jgi:hypothetical protein
MSSKLQSFLDWFRGLAQGGFKGGLFAARRWRPLRIFTELFVIVLRFRIESLECHNLWFLLAYTCKFDCLLLSLAIKSLISKIPFSRQWQHHHSSWFIIAVVITKLSSHHFWWFLIWFGWFYLAVNQLEHLLIWSKLKSFAADFLRNYLLGYSQRAAAIWRLFFYFFKLLLMHFLPTSSRQLLWIWRGLRFRSRRSLLAEFFGGLTSLGFSFLEGCFFFFLIQIYLLCFLIFHDLCSSKIWIINLE